MTTQSRILATAQWLLRGLVVLHSIAAASAQGPAARISVWDTMHAADGRLMAEQLTARDGWQQKTRRSKEKAFRGDAVISNGKILAVVRKQGSTVEVYGLGSGIPQLRAELNLMDHDGTVVTRLEQVALVENTRSAARLETRYETDRGIAVTASFRIKRGGIAIEAAPGPGAGRLRVDAISQYVVLPDFFADDILIDPTQFKLTSAEVPSDNLLMHMIDDGRAIAMCVFENSNQDVRVAFATKGQRPLIAGSEIRFGKDGKIWLAVMEAAGIWHDTNITSADAGAIKRLNWRMPFAAQWRVDFSRAQGLVDSWEMLYPDESGQGFIKPSWLPGAGANSSPSKTATGEIDVDAYQTGGPASDRLGADRQRWITFLGRFKYPCWTDEQGQGFIQPLKHKNRIKHEQLAFKGPAVVYPINRLPNTPLDMFTAVDVMRSTLGVGPCEYILNVESQNQDHVGRATCHVRRLLNEIYEAKRQRAKQAEIQTYLADGLDFVKHIRHRIHLYVEFGEQMREYLANQKKAHPEMAETLAEMAQIVSQLDERLESRRDGIKSPVYVAQLNEGFRKELLDYEGADAMVRLKRFTDALTRVGGSQDELVGECRWIVRTLRQRAALEMAKDPSFAEVAAEIRKRTQQVLLKPSAYEGARH